MSLVFPINEPSTCFMEVFQTIGNNHLYANITAEKRHIPALEVHVNSNKNLCKLQLMRKNLFIKNEPRCEKTRLPGFDMVPHKPGCRATEDSYRGLKFRKKRDCTIRAGEKKVLISFAVTAKS